MTTKLDSPLKRELTIGGAAYTLTIDPAGLTLVPKGKRKGYELNWEALINGEAALATALNAMLAKAPDPAVGKALAAEEEPSPKPGRRRPEESHGVRRTKRRTASRR